MSLVKTIFLARLMPDDTYQVVDVPGKKNGFGSYVQAYQWLTDHPELDGCWVLEFYSRR